MLSLNRAYQATGRLGFPRPKNLDHALLGVCEAVTKLWANALHVDSLDNSRAVLSQRLANLIIATLLVARHLECPDLETILETRLEQLAQEFGTKLN
jgi:hypothetical protein